MITYQVEPYSSVIDDIKVLYPAHWAEVASDKDVIPLEPDYDAYSKLASIDMLHCVTVRSDEKIVGYYYAMVMAHLHYRSCVTAFTDIFFIDKAHRGPTVAMRLFKFVESSLKARGVRKIYIGCKLKNDIGRLFERLGYTEIERSYSKYIGD